METQNQDVHGFRPGAIGAGVILLIVGAAMFLDTTGAVDIRFGRMIAPLVLITIGASMVLGRSACVMGHRACTVEGDTRPRLRRRGGPTSGIWLIGIGAWMLVSQNHVFGLTYHNSWPLFIVLSGIMLVIRGFK
jgi:hypothetical protein